MIDKIFFDITKYCNANCKYCFTNSSQVKDSRELTNKEIIVSLKEIKRNNINKVSIGGGEPFLKDIVSIINESQNMKISITTNGTILNNKIIECLQKNKNVKLTISLDSLSNEISNKIREGIDVNNVINNIVMLAKFKDIIDRISIRTAISKYNKDDIYNIIKFCDKNQIRNLKVNAVNEFGKAKENRSVILPFDDFMKVLDNILEYSDRNKIKTKIELPIEKYLNKSQECLCGTTSLYIDYKGDIFPCAFTEGELCLGNIKNKEFRYTKNFYCWRRTFLFR